VSLCQTIEKGEEFELINPVVDELNSKCSSEVAAGPASRQITEEQALREPDGTP
jgi:hypothetical protein